MATMLRRKRGQRMCRDISFMNDYSDDELSIHKRRQNGNVTLEIWGLRPRPEGEEVERECEFGHKHMVKSDVKRDVFSVYLDDADIRKLRAFLNDKEWCK